MKTKYSAFLLLTILIVSQFVSVSTVSAQCTLLDDGPSASGGVNWCFAAVIQMGTYYYTSSYFLQCEIVNFACENGFIDNASGGCVDCCNNSFYLTCTYYGTSYFDFPDLLEAWGFSNEHVGNISSFEDLSSHICDDEDPVLTTFWYGGGDGVAGYSHVLYMYDAYSLDDVDLVSYVNPDGGICYTSLYSTFVEWGYNGQAIWAYSDFISGNSSNIYGDPEARVSFFSPYIDGDDVKIAWKTDYEIDTDYFQVEKRSGKKGGRFITVGDKVFSKGDENKGAEYEVVDRSGSRGDYYRLMEIETTRRSSMVANSSVNSKEPAFMKGNTDPAYRSALPDEQVDDAYDPLIDSAGGSQKPTKPVPDGNYQWIAIYADNRFISFEPYVEDLVDLRSDYGLVAESFEYDQVMLTYGSINNFVKHLWETQEQSLKYVVLIGDASSCEYDDDCTVTDDNLIPMERFVDGYKGRAYHSDWQIGDVDDDGLPDIAIGRIPASSNSELDAYISKVERYEKLAHSPKDLREWEPYYKRVSLMLTDCNWVLTSGLYVNELGGLLSSQIAGYADPPDLFTLYKTDFGCNSYYVDREAAAIGEFDDGRGIIMVYSTYSDCRDMGGWLNTCVDLDNYFSVEELENKDVHPFLVAATCGLGNITLDWEDYTGTPMVEELLFSREGIIGAFAPTRNSMQYANYQIGSLLLDYIYDYGAHSIGHACAATVKRIVANNEITALTAKSYVLLGDPAIHLIGTPDPEIRTPNCIITHEYNGDLPFHVVCPAGDLDLIAFELDFIFDYQPSDIPAESLKLVFNNTEGTAAMFGSEDVHADYDATYETNYSTEISWPHFGGCGEGIMTVLLNDEPIATKYLYIKSPDIDGNGEVGLADFNTFTNSYGWSFGEEGFNSCCDYNNDLTCSLFDYQLFSEHYRHEFMPDLGASQQLLSKGLDIHEVAGLFSVDESTNDGRVDVKINTIKDSRLLFLAVSCDDAKVRFDRWMESANFAGLSIVSETKLDSRNVINLCIKPADAADKTGEAGKLIFEVVGGKYSSDGIKLEFGEVLYDDDVVQSLLDPESLDNIEKNTPLVDNLEDNYPNPFNPTTTVKYTLANDGQINISIYNVSGQLVRTVVNEFKKAGSYEFVWDGKNRDGVGVSSGIYFYTLRTNSNTITKKLVLIR